MNIKFGERGFIALRLEDPRNDGRVFREAAFEVAKRSVEGGGEESVVRCSVSSETPYLRYMKDPETGNYVDAYEVLGHKDGEIDFSRMRDGLVIQDTHWGDQIGIMDKPEVKDGKICGTVRFCSDERSKCIEKDALAGIRRNMSVGYIVNEYKRDGVAEDGYPIFRVTKWTPYEASFVPVPADTNIGVGRSSDPNGKRGGVAANPAGKSESAAAGKPSAANERNNKMKHTGEQVAEAFRLASAAHMEHAEVKELLESKENFEEVRSALMDKLEAYQKELAKKPAAPAKPAERAEILDEGERKEVKQRFSVMKVLRFLAGQKEDIGYEREVSDEIAKRCGKSAQGFYIPSCVRTVVAGDPANKGTTGANTIATNLLAGEFIEAVHDRMVLAAAGMRTISGLVGNVEIPKGGAVSGHWISAEGNDAQEETPEFGQVAATPHTAGAYVDLTRKFLMQTSISAEAFVTTELLMGIATLFEEAGFCGAGTSGAPLGIANTVGVPTESFSAGAPTLENLANMVAKCDTNNTLAAAMRWVMNPAVWAKLRCTYDWQAVVEDGAKVGGVSSGHYLLDVLTKTMEGFPYFTSNLCKAKELLFGDFSQLVMMLWGGTDITVDPYSLSKSGGLRIVALQDCDFIVRRPTAFVRGTTVIE